MFQEERDQARMDLNMRMEEANDTDSDSDSDSDSDYLSHSDSDSDCEVRLKEGSGRTCTHSLPYYMASLQMVMGSTPQVVQKMQKVMIKFMLELCPELELGKDWEEQIMAVSTLKVR